MSSAGSLLCQARTSSTYSLLLPVNVVNESFSHLTMPSIRSPSPPLKFDLPLGPLTTAPVSTSQLRVLYILEHNEGINLRTLTEALGSTPPSVSRLCDRLQAVGFVERAPSTNSRRELQLRLSARGRTFLRDLRARRERELRAVIGRMPAKQRAALLAGLESFCDTAYEELHPRREERAAGSGAWSA